ncbi:MFS transporter, partial [Actinoplanes sp. NPDC051633]|uniref:MFS transporter n=1 Tax=Actinoplanes sp. NPDC051633 TaxID=3155670 RepID=UPI00341DC356
MSSPSASEPRATWREWAGLAVLALPTLLVSLDIFVMLLALPQLSAQLGAGSSQQLWIMDVYGFMVAGFMITMGAIGDRIGRRKLLLIGAVLFGVASVIASQATSPGMLIAARAVLGVAGAAVSPSVLSLITNLFTNPKQRASAIGIWAGCFVVGAIIGPVVGGAMLAHFWWGSVFLLGVPAMVLLLVLGPVFLPEYRNPAAGRLDLTSVALSLAAILPFIYGVKELARHGWQPVSVVAIVIGAAFGVVFARRQQTLADPLLDLRLFTNPQFSISLGGLLSCSMLNGATMMFTAQHFQLVDGLTPLRAGLALLPGMVTSIVSVQIAPLLARRIRPAYLIGAGLAVTAIGMLVITQAGTANGPAALITGFAISCLGSAPLVALGTNLVMSSVPPEKAGSASGVVQTNSEFGYALGIAVMGSLGTFVYRTRIADDLPSGLPGTAADTARESITGAVTVAGELPGRLGAAVL